MPDLKLEDLKLDHRDFMVELGTGEEKKFTTRVGNNKELQDSEFEYSKRFNQCIMNGIVPQTSLIAKLKTAGAWSDQKDAEIEAKRQDVIKLEEQVETLEGKEKDSVIETLVGEKEILAGLRQQKNDLLSHSAETKAEETQRDFLVSCVTAYTDTGNKVWNDFDSYKNETDGNLLFRATYEYLTFANGVESDYTDEKTTEEKTTEEKTEEEEAPTEDRF